MGLLTNIEGAWRFEGNRVDEVNSLEFSFTPPESYDFSGKHGKAWETVNTSNSDLFINDLPSRLVPYDQDYSIAFWFKSDALASDVEICKVDDRADTAQYRYLTILVSTNGRVSLGLNKPGESISVTTAIGAASLNGTWNFVVVTYNKDTGTYTLRCNEEEADVITGWTPAAPISVLDWTFGRCDGGIDSLNVWSQTLTSVDITRLWYVGLGLEYPFSMPPPRVIADRGRWPIGVSQPPGQGGWDRPFIEPSARIEKLIADIFLAYEDNNNEFVLPFRITKLVKYGDGLTIPSSPNDRDLKIEDANGTVVMDTTVPATYTYSDYEWDSRLLISEWVAVDGSKVLRVIQHTAWSAEDEEILYDIEMTLAADEAVIDPRAIYQLPRRVNAFKVGLTTTDAATVRFKNGYNTEILTGETDLTDGARRNTELTLTAIPGGGSVGRYDSGCLDAPSPAIRRINGIEPTGDGRFFLDATGCYRIQRPILKSSWNVGIREVAIQDFALKVSNDCGPCCECQDFFNVWEAIRRLRDRYADLTALAQEIRDTYHANRERWLAANDCRLSDRLRIVMSSFCPGEMGVSVGYCNNSDKCLKNLVIPINFQYTDGTANPASRRDVTCEDGPNANEPLEAITTAAFYEVACASTIRSGNVASDQKTGTGCSAQMRNPPGEYYQLGGSWPFFWAHWDRVDPGGMAYVTFRLVFSSIDYSEVVQCVADAFTTDGKYKSNVGQPPIPGYVPGVGPVSTPESMRLVPYPRFASKGLQLAIGDAECCDDTDACSLSQSTSQ
jgi:hypothetical protein